MSLPHKLESPIVGLIVGILVIVGSAALLQFVRRDKTVATDYQSCISMKDSVSQESYPAVCMTPSGQRFVQPIDTPKQSFRTLYITEWDVSMKLTDQIQDASYTYDAASDQVTLRTTKQSSLIRSITGCTARLAGPYYARITVGQPKPYSNQLYSRPELEAMPNILGKQGDSYFTEAPVIEPTCAVQASAKTDKIAAIRSQLEAAFVSALSAR